MNKEQLLKNKHYSKIEKEEAFTFIKNITKDEFYNFYIANDLDTILKHFNISKNVMRLTRMYFDITEMCKKTDRGNFGHNKGWHYYNNSINEISIKEGEVVPDGYVMGRLPMTEETRKKLSNSRKGCTAHNKDKVCITDGIVNRYIDKNESLSDGFVYGNLNKDLIAYHDENNCVKYFRSDDVISDGYVKGTKDCYKNKYEHSHDSRVQNAEKFCIDDDCTPVTELTTLYPTKWWLDNDFMGSLTILYHGGYRYIKNNEIPRIESFKHLNRWERRMKHIEEFEKANDCICMDKLIEKYGQLQIIRELSKLQMYGAKFIANSDVEKVIDYYNSANKGYSNEEKSLLEYIESIYSGTVLENINTIITNPETGRGLQFDIYIPDKKIGIEYNGLYWHSSACNVPKDYHIKKSKLAEEQGIHLIHIYQDEWKYKQEKVKQFLNIIFGNIQHKIYARDCEVRTITNKDAEEFSNKTHFQGHRNASVTYGLFYQDELVQLMSFSKTANAKRNGAEWEIIRGCPGSNNIVIGGVSKLFTHFTRDYNPSSVFSYCDYNKFNGKSYEKIGMNFIGYTGPDKYWVINGRLVPRNPKKYKEFKERSYDTLWGAGSKKYIWYNTKSVVNTVN